MRKIKFAGVFYQESKSLSALREPQTHAWLGDCELLYVYVSVAFTDCAKSAFSMSSW